MSKESSSNRNEKQQQLPLPTAETIPFPYSTPYPQQIDLMNALLRTVQRDQKPSVMMLESPTGTGKSLSLACACMAWLRYREQQDLLSPLENDTTEGTTTIDTGIDWLDSWIPPEQKERQSRLEEGRKQARAARQQLSEALREIQQVTPEPLQRRNVLRNAITQAQLQAKKQNKRKRTTLPLQSSQDPGIEDFCLDEYHSEDEVDLDHESDYIDEQASNTKIHATTLLNGAYLDGSRSVNYTVGGVHPGSGVRKIIYAARTHSQLSQFVSELARTAWGSTVRVVALGGRKALCGHPTLRKKSETALNEACLDMAKSSSTACPLKNKTSIGTLALHMLVHPTDIEEAVELGSTTQTCAYYASRTAIAAAEVVVLPYSMLLSKQTRSSIGLSLQNALVLIDEAHNLPEALRSLHSCRLSETVVNVALEQLGQYVTKYMPRLAGRNLLYLGQIRKVLVSFQKHMQRANDKLDNRMLTPGELLMGLKLDNINLFKILRYMERSQLARKLLGFAKVTAAPLNTVEEVDSESLSKHVSAMSVVQTFLEKLCCSGHEGKIVTDRPSLKTPQTALRYVLLHPATFFENVIQEAHSLALVGGTLRPFGHVAAELLSDRPDLVAQAIRADSESICSQKTSLAIYSENITTFTCDHVVSPSNVLLQCVSKGPNGRPLDFRHHSRSSDATCDELGQTILGFCRCIPNGVVIFFPSYAYEAQLVRRWKHTGIWQELDRTKKVHREPKSSINIEKVLQAYSEDAKSKGGLLLSVVGGKMSEGINFSNEMARGVMVVGLPYPDITDPELKEKMATMDESQNLTITGQAYYHNLCMRSVNQSIGRAIRHADDYAAICLIDMRYETDKRVRSSLPLWIKKGTNDFRPKDFKAHEESIRIFFMKQR